MPGLTVPGSPAAAPAIHSMSMHSMGTAGKPSSR